MINEKDKGLIVERGAIFSEDENGGGSKAHSCEGARKLGSTDWEAPLAGGLRSGNIFEIRFKNTRKGYYDNVNKLKLKVGDIVAVEASPGHDIGIVSLTGNMVRKQMRCKRFNPDGVEFKKIYRIAKGNDIVKWQEAIALEHSTMISARRIAESLKLNMKIGDVEYQGDKIKAIFYYIADARVDFRELIRVFAEEFRVRIEMKQIGARQEAGRIGGIGSCGRQLCCSTWVTNFVSVTTNSARFQDISLNPQKLAGQCGKLKCCLNYEVDSYIDARKTFPKLHNPLETKDATYHLVKSDVLKGEMIFSSDPHTMVNVVSLPIARVRELIALNRKGVKVERLKELSDEDINITVPDYNNVVGDDSITRFDKESKNKRRNKNKRNNKGRGAEQNAKDTNANAAPKEERRQNNKPQREPREQKDTREPREQKDAREPREPREPRAPREKKVRELREQREPREPREQREPREPREPKEPREQREPREPREQDGKTEQRNNRPRRRWNNNKKGKGGTGGEGTPQ